MKKYKFFLPFLVLGLSTSLNPAIAAGKKLRVLFLGNSFTAANTLPLLVNDVATSAGDTLIPDWNAPGGYTLENHSTDASSLSKIAVGDWNYVVLQEQSQKPAFSDAEVAMDVFPYAKKLDSTIHKLNKCGRSVFFQTWGYRDGDALNCPTYPPICTYKGMDSLLELRYTQMADSNNALLSPVGLVFREIRSAFPAMDLYEPDGMHPSAIGSYAAALTFYTILFNKSPMGVAFNYTLTPPEALQIKNIVLLNVYNKIAKFGVGAYNPDASFTYSVTAGTKTANFNSSASLYAVNYNWDFGDGGTAITANPSHNYATDGTYTVRLIVDNCQLKDTTTMSVVIPKTGNIAEQNLLQNIQLYPNPANNVVYVLSPITLNKAQYSITNLVGQLVSAPKNLTQNIIDISHLAAGVYLVKIEDQISGQTISRKFVKE